MSCVKKVLMKKATEHAAENASESWQKLALLKEF
jgi:hypothetical protein